jgi:hypothetical protein
MDLPCGATRERYEAVMVCHACGLCWDESDGPPAGCRARREAEIVTANASPTNARRDGAIPTR